MNKYLTIGIIALLISAISVYAYFNVNGVGKTKEACYADAQSNADAHCNDWCLENHPGSTGGAVDWSSCHGVFNENEGTCHLSCNTCACKFPAEAQATPF